MIETNKLYNVNCLDVTGLIGDIIYFINSNKSRKHKHNITSGRYAHSATSRDISHSITSGDCSHSVTSGNCSHSITLGFKSHSATSGDGSFSVALGDCANSVTSGEYAYSSVFGRRSIAAALGIEGKAKGALGCWIVLAEWIKNERNYYPVSVQAVKVDGQKIKADTWYMLKNGKFIEVNQ